MLGSISHLVFHDFVEVLRRKKREAAGQICYCQKTDVSRVASVHTTPGGSEQVGDASVFDQCRVLIVITAKRRACIRIRYVLVNVRGAYRSTLHLLHLTAQSRAH